MTRAQDGKLRASYYWIQTIYGLLSFPFVIFKLPVAAAVLMHCKPTGYNLQGKTVRQIRKRARNAEFKK